MTVKALKKQLMAAIAMVVVSAIALSSSTYAWFASNNSVKANMSSIMATSDAAFLEISKVKTGEIPTWSNATYVDFTSGSTKALLPARYKATSETKFETAFATGPEAATEKEDSAFNITEANLSKYVWKETVYIRAQSGTYNNLSVNSLVINKVGDTSGLISAGRILAVCGDNVQLWKNNAKVSGDEYLMTGNITQTNYATVDLYFYYDGDDDNVFTNNLDALLAISSSISFSAQQITD